LIHLLSDAVVDYRQDVNITVRDFTDLQYMICIYTRAAIQ